MLSKTSNDVLAEINTIQNAAGINLMQWLLQHERIHHGKLILYMSQLHFTLPESFMKAWGRE